MSIAENVKIVMDKVATAAIRAGRRPEDITVVGVTKTVGADNVAEMFHAGIRDAGENRVQELLAKREALAGSLPGIKWHMIGHLQTNKVKQAVLNAEMIHSVDSVKLAELIDRNAALTDRVMDVLVEVNIAAEESKFGVDPKKVHEFVGDISRYSNINVRGLMCVAPIVENPDKNRPFFCKMKKLMLDINERIYHNNKMDVLSMGMSMDYEAAILEGACIVRVGTAIFGPR